MENKVMKRRSASNHVASLSGDDAPNIKWSNKYDCPDGYVFNEDGYVITSVPYPKMGVSIAPWQLRELTPLALFSWNLVVLMLLNPGLDIEYLSSHLNSNMYNNIGRRLAYDELEKGINNAMSIRTLEDLKGIPTYIFKFDTVWYEKNSTIKSVRDVIRIRDAETIDIARDMMEINKKWKTSEVSIYTDRSQYVIRNYWKQRGFSTTDRTIAAIVEASDYITREMEEDMDRKLLSEVAGVSISALDTNKDLVNKLLNSSSSRGIKELSMNSNSNNNNSEEL
jgi:hypothetical protein